jgi:hypothetical protein
MTPATASPPSGRVTWRAGSDRIAVRLDARAAVPRLHRDRRRARRTARLMARRVVVRIFLPIEMGAAARIMAAVAEACPGARLGDSGDPSVIDLVIDEPELEPPEDAS